MTAIDILIASANEIELLLFEMARTDDPHRVATIPAEFDDGRALRSIVVDTLGSTKRRIALRLTGTIESEEKVIELHAIVVDVPPAPTAP